MPAELAGVDATLLLQQVLLSRASALARAGALASAAELLGPADQAGFEHVPTLDLLARIRAQNGEWVQAERLWLRVQRLAPGHAGATAGLARLRRGRGAAAWVGLVARAVLAVALPLMAVALFVQHQALRDLKEAGAALDAARAERDAARSHALDARLAAIQESNQAAMRRLAEQDARRTPQPPDAVAGLSSPPQLAFAVAGLRSAPRGDALALWFEAAPFDAQGRLGAAARGKLRTLARAIVMTQERLVVEVAAIDTPTTRSTPARLRAERAAWALRQAGVLPRHGIRAVSRVAQAGDPAGATLVLRVMRAPAAAATTS